MNQRRLTLPLALLALAVLLPASANAQPQQPTVAMLPVDAFGAIPIFRNPHLSPDGRHLAAIQSYKGRPVAVIYDLKAAKGAMPTIVESDEWTVEDLRWVKNDDLMVVIKSSLNAVDGRLRTWVRSLLVDAQGKNARILMENERTLDNNTVTARIVDGMPNDPDHFLTSLFRNHMVVGRVDIGGGQPFYYDLLQVDVKTGTSHVIQEGGPDTREWFTDGHGQVIGRLDHNTVSQSDRLMVMTGGDMHEAGRFQAGGAQGAEIEGLTEDGKALVRVARDDKGFRILVRRDLTTGEETSLFAAPGYDVAHPLYDEWNHRVIGAAYTGDKPEFVYFDPARQALQRGLEKAFPGQSVGIVSEDATRNTLIVLLEGSVMAPVYFVLDRTTHDMHPVARPYPALADIVLPEMKNYDYKARDGLKIPAYLTLPLGKPAKSLPLVVMPHGGPDARDALGFNWWAQFLANRGYAVLQPNYRGSAGYGAGFTDAGLRQWGLKMQDDISDGVKKAIADGIADPKRVCIVGASYGGYAALAGAAFSPDLYACAVAFAGVSDLPLMLRTERRDYGEYSRTASFWATRIGSSDENWDQLVATSPARNAAKVRCPVLLMHGEGDTTVRIEQSEEMAGALKDAGKSVEFIRFPGEDHYLNLTETRVRVLTETEKFLDKNIGH
ncbi:MAG TPA: alpha/beta fold hydrolase [Rhizomicrobium sp.]|nr:alpha/beta fold hydrolase [Rhizomicrobium sp.]